MTRKLGKGKKKWKEIGQRKLDQFSENTNNINIKR